MKISFDTSVSIVINTFIYILTKNNLPVTFKILGVALATVLISTSGLAQTKSSLTHKRFGMGGAEPGAGGTTITMGGNPIDTVGKLSSGHSTKKLYFNRHRPEGKTLPDYKGIYLVLNILPSVNTGVCSKSVRTFNKDAAGLKNTTVLCICKDLRFAQKAFCGAEGINNVVMLSDFGNDFGKTFTVQIADGPLKSHLSRAGYCRKP